MSKFENNMEDMFDIEVESTDIEPTKPNLLLARRRMIRQKITNIPEGLYTRS